MGRTAPSTRIPVEEELERLRRLARHLKNPRDRELLLEALDKVYDIVDAYRYTPMHDPLEPILLALVLRCLENRRKTASSPQA
ncbi:MAG: hypothetical protein GSR77_00015 [Desulfurococcales archaeon]|nr:hypothetical protein [Desulfurococcales archaeon]